MNGKFQASDRSTGNGDKGAVTGLSSFGRETQKADVRPRSHLSHCYLLEAVSKALEQPHIMAGVASAAER